MSPIVQLYKNAFNGLSRPAWMLSIVMLINRSGTMVLPFLSIYLTGSLGFSLKQTGIILKTSLLPKQEHRLAGWRLWIRNKFHSGI